MKKVLMIIFMLFSMSIISYAQLTQGKSYLGPALGFNLSNSSFTFGANYEYAINKNIGVGGIFRYTSYKEDLFFFDYSYTYMFFGAQGNYHFEGLIEDKKFDPFVGLVLGYNTVSVKIGDVSGKGSGDLFVSAHATMRYWLNPSLGVQARLEFGSVSSSGLMLGVDFVF